jgi:signal peptidase II
MNSRNETAPVMVLTARHFSRWLVGALAITVITADQVTKLLVVRMIPEHDIIPIIPGLLNLTHSTNAGVAFGMFSDSPAAWKTALLTVVSLGLLAVVFAMVWRAKSLDISAGLGLSLVLGGALSNLADRIRAGAVVDFLDAYVRAYHWYTFNVADAAIVVGAVFLVIHLFRSE